MHKIFNLNEKLYNLYICILYHSYLYVSSYNENLILNDSGYIKLLALYMSICVSK